MARIMEASDTVSSIFKPRQEFGLLIRTETAGEDVNGNYEVLFAEDENVNTALWVEDGVLNQDNRLAVYECPKGFACMVQFSGTGSPNVVCEVEYVYRDRASEQLGVPIDGDILADEV